ncbi:MAG TPA: hypothetical protein VFG62_24685 [Rhodopila sp.]|jgi:hypothetical protein|nr:hypothetical protein [Rhodopila sp.]
MQLIFSNAENTTIQATLDDKETLGNVSGPGVFFVPTDPANAEYAEIVAEGMKVEPYEPPPVPPPEAVDLPPVMPTDPTHATPKAYVDTEIAALAARIETLEARLG